MPNDCLDQFETPESRFNFQERQRRLHTRRGFTQSTVTVTVIMSADKPSTVESQRTLPSTSNTRSQTDIIKDPVTILATTSDDSVNATRTRSEHKHLLNHLKQLQRKPQKDLSKHLQQSTRSTTSGALCAIVTFPPIIALLDPNVGDKMPHRRRAASVDRACQLRTEWAADRRASSMLERTTLLHAVQRPQLYAHCGIMAKIYCEIANANCGPTLAGSAFSGQAVWATGDGGHRSQVV